LITAVPADHPPTMLDHKEVVDRVVNIVAARVDLLVDLVDLEETMEVSVEGSEVHMEATREDLVETMEVTMEEAKEAIMEDLVVDLEGLIWEEIREADGIMDITTEVRSARVGMGLLY